MFTGIIEALGTVQEVVIIGTNKTFRIGTPLSHDLKIDQSVSHNGACLTVEEVNENDYGVTAIRETLKKTNLGLWVVGDSINLERCLPVTGRLDGHFVQGHVDTTAICNGIKKRKGSQEFTFQFPRKFNHLLIEKGSISLNGISLTVFNVKKTKFSVAIIPYTLEHTNMKGIIPGSMVNLEFDMIGKYVHRSLPLK